MPCLHVCPLSLLHSTVRDSGARSIVTLINPGTWVERPAEVAPDQHVFIGISDIVEPLEGHILPGHDHVARLLAFARRWNRRAPLVVHCYAGVSRSTAAAYIITCALNSRCSEFELADALRMASPTATPNARLVAVADEILARGGRMVAAIKAIGRGEDCFEAVPFRLDLASGVARVAPP
jgi:predicted protein tyrosine phosphatase